MVAMTMNNQLYIAANLSAVNSYYTVIGDFLSKIKSEIKLHRDISEICNSFDGLISVCKVAQHKVEAAIDESRHLKTPMPFWHFVDIAEDVLPTVFDEIIRSLEKEESSWLTCNKQLEAIDKAKKSKAALLRLIQSVQTFNTMDSWDLQLVKKVMNKTIHQELEATSIQVSTEDWKYILQSIAADKVNPSVPDEAKKAAKNYRAILSS